MPTKTRIRRPTIDDKLEAEIRARMDRRFEKFVINERSRNGIYRSWYCAEPGEWDCSFTITTIPYYLFVTGDLGCLTVSRCYDMLPWCKRSCESTHYFAEKIPREFQTREFSSDKVREWARDELRGLIKQQREYFDADPESISTMWEAINDGFDERGEDYFAELFSDIIDGSDFPDWTVWNDRFLYLREAVRWFVNHCDEPVIPEPR